MGSDHRHVLVKPLSSQESYRGSFRFDKRMLNKPLVKETVVRAWNWPPVSFGSSVTERLRSCRKALSRWKHENNMSSKEKIQQIQQQLEVEIALIAPSFVRLDRLQRELLFAHKEEESFWQQKCCKSWAKDGDLNTKFFHASVKGTRTKNNLEKLVDVNGIMQRSDASKGKVDIQYFTNLFTSTSPSNPHDIFSEFPAKIYDDLNAHLISKVSVKEIRDVVFSIKRSSAPGADGMTGFFYQQYWDVVEPQVTVEILRFFESGIFPKSGISPSCI